jgi:hypothetical protein
MAIDVHGLMGGNFVPGGRQSGTWSSRPSTMFLFSGSGALSKPAVRFYRRLSPREGRTEAMRNYLHASKVSGSELFHGG